MRHESQPALCESPIFIVGSPRSGTTALARALGSHPELWVSNESFFIHQLFGNGRAGQVWAQNQRRATPSWLRHEDVSRSEFLAALGLGVNALYTSRSGGLRWIDQTPRYTPMVGDLADMFPGACFIHIIRDGRAVVRSMQAFKDAFDEETRSQIVDELPDWVEDFQLACSTWAEWVQAATRFELEHPDRMVTVRNDSLAMNPHQEFARLLSFIGASDDDTPALTFSSRRVNSSFARDRPADDNYADWTHEMRKMFSQEAGDVLVANRYATADALTAWLEESPASTDGEGDRE